MTLPSSSWSARAFATLLVAVLPVACTTVVSEPFVGPPAFVPAEVATRTSYHNRHGVGWSPVGAPAGVATRIPYAWGDFAGNGRLDLFAASLTYNPALPLEDATPAQYRFLRRQADGSFVEASDLWTSSLTPPCIHPRQALVADLNGDGRSDVFIACHGYDANPFPGERNQVLLSQPDGSYTVEDAAERVGFHHGAALMDFDGDGDADVLLVDIMDPARISVMQNDGTGHFAPDRRYRFPSELRERPYFIATLVDVDGDGRSDVVVGGHEWQSGAATKVLLNPGNNDFSVASPIDLPAVAGYGVVLDALVTGTGADRALWILRAGGETGDLNFYGGTAVQRVLWQSGTSSTLLASRTLAWEPWFITTPGPLTVTTPFTPAGFSVTAP